MDVRWRKMQYTYAQERANLYFYQRWDPFALGLYSFFIFLPILITVFKIIVGKSKLCRPERQYNTD